MALVLKFAWLLDDAYVYFRYVDNLVIHGAGLVWNPGEFVEGFSSPLWVLLLVVLRFLRADYWATVRVAGVLSFGAVWWAAVAVNRRLMSDAGARVSSANVPLVCLSLNYGLLTGLTSGLETPLVIAMAGAYACSVLWPGSTILQIVVGLSPMVRHELLIPFVLLMMYIYARSRRVPVAAIASCAASLGAYLVFRVWYYADLLPNTFYLKDEVWVKQGLRYLRDAAMPYGTVPYLVVAAALCLLLGRAIGVRRAEIAGRLAMLGLGAPVTAYVVKIGGSSLHMKALVFPFTLAVLAAGGLAEAAASRWAGKSARHLWIAALLLGFLMAACHPRQLSGSPVLSSRGLVYRHVDLIGDGFHQRHASTKGVTPRRGSDVLSYAAATRRYSSRRDPQVRPEWWCRSAYVRPAAPVVHSLGLTDPFLARTRIRSDRPDHKEGLTVLADHIAWIRQEYGFVPGAFDAAVADGRAPEWVAWNIAAIRGIEARAYNRHRFWANLRLALSRTGRIERPPQRPGQAPADSTGMPSTGPYGVSS